MKSVSDINVIQIENKGQGKCIGMWEMDFINTFKWFRLNVWKFKENNPYSNC